jgi:class 3 adenylate cyclase
VRETESLFALLRQAADPDAAAALERLVASGEDHALNRVNVLDFARRHGLGEERAIAAFLHAARLGLFDLSWNVLCPGCGGVLEAGASLKRVDRSEYRCALCAAGYEPTLDEMVEVTFTVHPRVRRIAAHAPDALPWPEYFRQIFWASGIDLPEDVTRLLEAVTLETVELPPGGHAILSLQLPPAFLILFDPVTHATQFMDVQGEPTTERQTVTLVLDEVLRSNQTIALRPGPLRLTLESRASRRTLPGIWIANHDLHELLGRRKPFLTAKRLLSNQTFRDLYRTDTLDLDQRLKITSLTFLFTDLKGSTALYDRVGDLAAFDLVRAHFRLLQEIVAAEAGAVVKTIGDAVMATFPTPAGALAAALRMREAMRAFNEAHGGGRDDLLLKIGIHEGPCLAVMLNDRQDFFGQTVNVAARVQALAASPALAVTRSVIEDPEAAAVLRAAGLAPTLRDTALRGVTERVGVYELG